jgi:hypothetical protein
MKPAPGPYRVEQFDGPAGPRWRLTGPGLADAKGHPHPEVRERLEDLAAVMNFAWQEAVKADRSAD